MDPLQSGFSVYPARSQGLEASQGATDFGEYFLYFSFFLVVSALMLAGLFFKLGVEQRLREIGLLQALGFSAARIRIFFLSEGLLLACLGSIGGLAGALAYGALMIVGLRTWWSGAVGTTDLHLHVSPMSLFSGGVGGVLAALGYIAWTLRSLNPISPRSLLAGNRETAEVGRYSKLAKGRHDRAGVVSLQQEQRRLPKIAPSPPSGERVRGRVAVREAKKSGPEHNNSTSRTSSILNLKYFISCFRIGGLDPVSPAAAWTFSFSGLLLILCAQQKWINQVMGFFGAGTVLLVALLCHQAIWLRRDRRKVLQGRGWWALFRLGLRNATHRPGRSILCVALIASACFIVVALDAFRWGGASSLEDKEPGSGGYPLLAESLLPLYHDLNSTEGRQALNLDSSDYPVLKDVSFSRFRVRPGDDTSCLNLYQPRNPKILAASDTFIKSGRFAFRDSMARSPEEKRNPWLLLEKEIGEGKIPVIADSNSMAYALHLRLGEELALNQGSHPIRLKLVGALADSLFQSEILMSEPNFLRLFPDQEGYRFFLLDVAREKAPAVAALLEDRLSDFGFDAIPTAERLAGFHRVENTYLSTFQSLGGLGLVLGTMGLAAVLLRNALERRRELALLQAVGYNPSRLGLIIVSENILLLGAGIVTGTLCALLAIVPAFSARGGPLPILSMSSLLLAVLTAGGAASLLATAIALRSPLLSALRSE
jgi:ABC-type lipoprotein release transport system permease subunit